MTDGTSHYTRPDVAAFLVFLNAQDGPKMEELPPEAAALAAPYGGWHDPHDLA